MNKDIQSDLIINGAQKVDFLTLFVFYFSKPSFKIIYLFRLYSKLYKAGGYKKIIGKLIWLHAVNVSGCHISPKAQIGKGLFLPHPTGIVIGDGVVLGENVTIYQNVTIGKKSQNELCPRIGSFCIIYAGSCIIGGIQIGKSTIIGANSVVIHNIAEHSTVVGSPAKSINEKK